MKYITKFTYDKHDFEGYRVRYHRAGRKFTRYFSRKACGSWGAALSEAKAFLGNLKRILDPIPPQTRRRDVRHGAGAVRRGSCPGKGGSRIYFHEATLTLNGERKVRKFSTAKHGIRRAKILALEALEKMREKAPPRISAAEIDRRVKEARELCSK